jgi:hypothetical protein
VDFVLIFGPPAVGKMTVGHALARLTGLKLFHNHMTIDLVLPFFPFGTPPFGRLVGEFRRRIFEEVAASDGPGLIFTYVWALSDPGDTAYVDSLCAIFRERGARVAYAELYAEQAERLQRNRTPFRLEHKPSKRDVEWSDANLRDLDARYQLNTAGDFAYPDAHLRLDTTRLPAEEAARRIAERFALPLADADAK